MSIANAELLYPETAIAIAAVETGNFTSRKLMKSHNWFGFRRNRRGYQLRGSGPYGTYATPEAMLAEYTSWETEVCLKYSLNNEKVFRAWVNKNYADADYPQKLANKLSLIESIWN